MNREPDENIEVGRRYMREENRKRLTKKAKRQAVGGIAAGIVILVLAVFLFVQGKTQSYNSVKVVESVKTSYEPNAQYLEFGGNLLKYSPDGVSYINAEGDTVWTAGIDLAVPIAETAGRYAVVADKGGNTVAVFDQDGEVSKVTMPYEIEDVDVTEKGEFAAVLKGDDVNYISMYDSNGKRIHNAHTTLDKSGYPMDITLSDDGEKLFVSFFRVDGVKIQNTLSAYNFGTVGENADADNIVAGMDMGDSFFPRVQFVNNDTVAAFSDNGIVFYNMKEEPEKCGEVHCKGTISSVFCSSSYVGVIQPSSDTGSAKGYAMRAYDFKGNELFTYSFGFDYDRICADKNEVIVSGGNQCLIVRKNGQAKFSYSFSSAIHSIVPSSRRNEYIVTFEDKTETVRLRSVSN